MNRQTSNTNKRISILTASIILAMMLACGTAMAAKPSQGGYTGPGATVQPAGPGGGYTGPGLAPGTVEDAKKMRDDERVVLVGKIVRSLGGKHYVFQDSTGEIEIEIDKKRWRGQSIGAEDTVEIRGEVDKDWNKVTIDVKELIKR